MLAGGDASEDDRSCVLLKARERCWRSGRWVGGRARVEGLSMALEGWGEYKSFGWGGGDGAGNFWISNQAACGMDWIVEEASEGVSPLPP
jgi:hypothetical protein